MAKVQAHLQDCVQLVSCSQNGQIVFVFCHVGSHARADVDAAMTGISGKRTEAIDAQIAIDVLDLQECF